METALPSLAIPAALLEGGHAGITARAWAEVLERLGMGGARQVKQRHCANSWLCVWNSSASTEAQAGATAVQSGEISAVTLSVRRPLIQSILEFNSISTPTAEATRAALLVRV